MNALLLKVQGFQNCFFSETSCAQPTKTLLINFRLSSNAEILLKSTWQSSPNMYAMCRYRFQLSFHFAYHRWWLGGTSVFQTGSRVSPSLPLSQDDNPSFEKEGRKCDRKMDRGHHQLNWSKSDIFLPFHLFFGNIFSRKDPQKKRKKNTTFSSIFFHSSL